MMTPEKIAFAMDQRSANASWQSIAKTLRLSVEIVRRAVDPEYKARRNRLAADNMYKRCACRRGRYKYAE